MGTALPTNTLLDDKVSLDSTNEVSEGLKEVETEAGWVCVEEELMEWKDKTEEDDVDDGGAVPGMVVE